MERSARPWHNAGILFCRQQAPSVVSSFLSPPPLPGQYPRQILFTESCCSLMLIPPCPESFPLTNTAGNNKRLLLLASGNRETISFFAFVSLRYLGTCWDSLPFSGHTPTVPLHPPYVSWQLYENRTRREKIGYPDSPRVLEPRDVTFDLSSPLSRASRHASGKVTCKKQIWDMKPCARDPGLGQADGCI